MTQHLPERPMLVGQLQKALIIAVDAKTECAQYQHTPEIHARTAVTAINVLLNRLFKSLEDSLLQFRSDVDILEGTEQPGDVIAGALIEADRRDIDCTQLFLRLKWAQMTDA